MSKSTSELLTRIQKGIVSPSSLPHWVTGKQAKRVKRFLRQNGRKGSK